MKLLVYLKQRMSNKKLLFFIIFISVALLIGSYLLINKPDEQQTKVLSYSATDKNKPAAEINENFKKLGNIKVSDTSKTTFKIKNSGTKPLQLSKINSSCGCTAGQIIYKGVISKEYSMHSKSSDIFEIAPNTEAELIIVYRPFTMPVYGFVEREVYIFTNDPNNPKLSFKIQANVN